MAAKAAGKPPGASCFMVASRQSASEAPPAPPTLDPGARGGGLRGRGMDVPGRPTRPFRGRWTFSALPRPGSPRRLRGKTCSRMRCVCLCVMPHKRGRPVQTWQSRRRRAGLGTRPYEGCGMGVGAAPCGRPLPVGRGLPAGGAGLARGGQVWDPPLRRVRNGRRGGPMWPPASRRGTTRRAGARPRRLRCACAQNSPEILPFSSTSTFSAAGTLGRPGMDPRRTFVLRGPGFLSARAESIRPASRFWLRQNAWAPHRRRL